MKNARSRSQRINKRVIMNDKSKKIPTASNIMGTNDTSQISQKKAMMTTVYSDAKSANDRHSPQLDEE